MMTMLRPFACAVLLVACARPSPPPPNEAPANDVRAAASVAPTSAPAASPAIATTEEHDAAGGDGASSSAAAVAPSAPLEGQDFIAEAKLLFRLGACGGASADSAESSRSVDGGADAGLLFGRFDPQVVARHCEELERAYRDYQKSWIDLARPFIAALRPQDLPRTVVYPFGGGDLTSVLATYPDATEITTISLEPAGDVRPVDVLAPERLGQELAEHRSHLERLFQKAHSRTDNLEKESKTDLPGEILFALAALAVYGDEPVSLRYFQLKPDGSISYVTAANLAAARGPVERHALTANAELRFRRAGATDAAVRVFRHIGFNLDDTHLRADPSLLAHLNTKGKVAAMTKAASHLLWNDQFSMIRDWLLEHTDWMISDSTGVPPRLATKAGFVQDTYGTFDGPAPFGLLNPRDGADLKHLFSSEPTRELPFRFGYPDQNGHGHLIVTRRAPPGSFAMDGGHE